VFFLALSQHIQTALFTTGYFKLLSTCNQQDSNKPLTYREITRRNEFTSWFSRLLHIFASKKFSL